MSVDPAPRKAQVISDSYQVSVALARIGIPEELLLLAVEKGQLERRLATPLDFPGRGEYDAASQALRTICEEGGKTAGSWHRDQYLGIPVAFNLDKSIAISVTAADEYAGMDGEHDPRTRSLKGANTGAAITRQTLSLTHPEDDAEPGVVMWYLLTNVTEDAVLSELARPEMLDDDGRITCWVERVLLGRIDLNGDGTVRRGVPTPPTSPIEINPLRRSG